MSCLVPGSPGQARGGGDRHGDTVLPLTQSSRWGPVKGSGEMTPSGGTSLSGESRSLDAGDRPANGSSPPVSIKGWFDPDLLPCGRNEKQGIFPQENTLGSSIAGATALNASGARRVIDRRTQTRAGRRSEGRRVVSARGLWLFQRLVHFGLNLTCRHAARVGNSDRRIVTARGWESGGSRGVTVSRSLFTFRGDEKVPELDGVMLAQLCEHTKTHSGLHT